MNRSSELNPRSIEILEECHNLLQAFTDPAGQWNAVLSIFTRVRTVLLSTKYETQFEGISKVSWHRATLTEVSFGDGVVHSNQDRVNYTKAQNQKLADNAVRCASEMISTIISMESQNTPAVSDSIGNVINLSVDIFVVHGHDEEMKQAVARTLERLGLNPIILHEQPNGGKTIIEKFEKHGDVGFAVVLLSPDDMGYKKADGAKAAMPRARQNVILELGYFVGRLGRGKVMALKRGNDLEVPGDFDGVVYTPFDEHEGWQKKLVKELKAADYNIDANAL